MLGGEGKVRIGRVVEAITEQDDDQEPFPTRGG